MSSNNSLDANILSGTSKSMFSRFGSPFFSLNTGSALPTVIEDLFFGKSQLLYFVVYTSEKEDPSPSQIRMGLDCLNRPPIASGNQESLVVAEETEVLFSVVGGLDSNTSYKIAFVWSDGNQYSNVSVSPPFQLSGTGGGTILKYWNGSEWISKELKYWDGVEWAAAVLKIWNGSWNNI